MRSEGSVFIVLLYDCFLANKDLRPIPEQIMPSNIIFLGAARYASISKGHSTVSTAENFSHDFMNCTLVLPSKIFCVPGMKQLAITFSMITQIQLLMLEKEYAKDARRLQVCGMGLLY
jgi:hypothetical protein